MKITYKEITTIEKVDGIESSNKEQRVEIEVSDERWKNLQPIVFQLSLADANLLNARLGDVLADIPF